MKAISLWQPWAWLLVHGHEHPNGKRIENRTRPLPPSMVGKWQLIQAAKKRDIGAHVAGCVTASLTMGGSPVPALDLQERGGIVGAVKWGGSSDNWRDFPDGIEIAWFEGKWAWWTVDALPLPFVELKGRQGFFDVDDELVKRYGIDKRIAEHMAAAVGAVVPAQVDVSAGGLNCAGAVGRAEGP